MEVPVLPFVQLVNMKMMKPTNVLHVTLLVLTVTEVPILIVLDVKIQDISKITIVLNHHVKMDPIQILVIMNVKHVMLFVLIVLVQLMENVPNVFLDIIFIMVNVFLHVQMDILLVMVSVINVVLIVVLVVVMQIPVLDVAIIPF